jgi:hypothetical protein
MLFTDGCTFQKKYQGEKKEIQKPLIKAKQDDGHINSVGI